jgi:hypothetical protein
VEATQRKQVLQLAGELQPLSVIKNTSGLSVNLLAANRSAEPSGSTQVDAEFLRQLTEILRNQWVLSVLDNLPLPGADTPLSSGVSEGSAGLVGPSASDFLQLWTSMVDTAAPVQPATDESAGTTPATSPLPTANADKAVIASAAKSAAERYNVPEALIYSVMEQESGMNPRAQSAAGAIGLMQLMPDTARALGVNPWDPVQNIDGGTRYLSQLLQEFGGDVRLALAAYNAGPEAVRQYGGIPPYPETEAYVQSVLARL